MQQLEIEYFFPLTEQVLLDLDYRPSYEYDAKKRADMIAGSVVTIGGTGATWGSVTVSNDVSLKHMAEFRPNPKSVGYWLVSPELKYYVSEEPNWIVKRMTKFLLGWKWGK